MDLLSGANNDWNPGRSRGVAAYEVHASDRGLWVGSDTSSIGTGDTYEIRQRVAFFPAESGKKSATWTAQGVPVCDSPGDQTATASVSIAVRDAIGQTTEALRIRRIRSREARREELPTLEEADPTRRPAAKNRVHHGRSVAENSLPFA